MRRAKRIVWMLNGILLMVILMFGVIYLIGSSKGLLNEDSQKEVEQKRATQIMVEGDSNDIASPSKKRRTGEGKKPTTIVLGGDIVLKESHLENYKEKGISGLVSSEVLEIIQKADIAMINEEFAFTNEEESTREEDTYRVAPKYVPVFNELGIDLVSLANNHILDYGKQALLECISTLDAAQIKHVGAGETLEQASTIQYVEVNGYTIAFVAASRVMPEESWAATETDAGVFSAYDSERVCKQVKEASENADFVIAYVHWGMEYKTKVDREQRELGQALVDAGADVVFGSHNHCLQGIEYYKGCPILYSLGNLIFDQTQKKTAIVTISLSGRTEPELAIHPCFLKNGKTDLTTKRSSVSSFYEYMMSISQNTQIGSGGEIRSKGE